MKSPAGLQRIDTVFKPIRSQEEIRGLRERFFRAVARVPKVKKVKPLKMRFRRKITEDDLRRGLFLRYGGQPHLGVARMSLSEVARQLRIPQASFFNAFKRYTNDGFQVINRHKLPRPHHKRMTKLKDAVADYLLDFKTLQAWSGFTLEQRCKLIEQKFGISVRYRALSLFYRKHKVKRYVVGYKYQQEERMVDEADIQRYTLDLARRIVKGEKIIYMDESSVNLWMKNRQTWCNYSRPVRMQLNKFRGNGITVFGAIGSCLPKAVFMQSHTTSAANFLPFLS